MMQQQYFDNKLSPKKQTEDLAKWGKILGMTAQSKKNKMNLPFGHAASDIQMLKII